MKIRKQIHWRPCAPRLKKKLTFEQRFSRLIKSTLKIGLISAFYSMARMSPVERASFLTSLSEPLPFLPSRL